MSLDGEQKPKWGGFNRNIFLATTSCIVGSSFQYGYNIAVLNEPQEGFTKNIAFATLSCVVGSSFQYGYNTALLNAPEEIIKRFINESHETRSNEIISEELLTNTWALASSGFGIGAMIGALFAGPINGRYGSKRSILFNNIFALLASGFSVSSKFLGLVEMLIVGRIFIGINAGFNCVAVPMYLTEISTLSIRGILGAGHQIGIGVSVILANVLGLGETLGTEERWPILFAAIAALAIFQLCTLPWCPESPRFLLISRNNQPAAESALKWLRGSSDVHHDINEMKIERRELQLLKKFSVLDLPRNGDLRRPLIICIVVHLSQQMCGVAAFALYSTSVFEQVVNSVELSTYLAVGLSVFAFIVCVVFTGFVEKSGRRMLHLCGVAGMCISMILITVCFIYQKQTDWLKYGSLIGVFLYIFFFNIGPGSIPWFIVAEMFTQQSKSSAMTVSVFFNTFSGFIVSFVFPDIQEYIQDYSFVPFICLAAMFWIFFYLKLPETKGRTIEEVAEQFRSKKTKSILKLMEKDDVSTSNDYSTETVSTRL